MLRYPYDVGLINYLLRLLCLSWLCLFSINLSAQDNLKSIYLEPLNIEKFSTLSNDVGVKLAPLKDYKSLEELNLALPKIEGNATQNDLTQAIELTVADVRKLALENNLGINIVKFDSKIANTALKEERAKFDNIVYANIKSSNKDKLSTSLGASKLSSVNPQLNDQQVKLTSLESESAILEGELGLLIPLRTGAKVKISSPFSNNESNYNQSKFDTNEFNSALKFSIVQPLLRNSGIAANEASIQIADKDASAIDAKTKLQMIRVLSTVEKAYWEVNRTWDELEIRIKQHEYAISNLEMVKKRVNEGLSAAIEVNRAQVGVADRLEALIVASTKLKIAQRQLRLYLNQPDHPVTSERLYIPSTEPELVSFNLDRVGLVEKALSNRLELLELELKLSADITKISYLENQTLPMFNFEYQYGALSNTSDSFSRSYRNIDGRFNEWSIGFSFEMPITNEARKMQLERAILTRQQRLSTKVLQELSVKREILDTVDEIDQNWRRVLAARQQVIIAGINYEAEVKQFKEGLRTMTEVLESLTRLGEAQIREVRAVSDYQITKIDLAYATGTLLGASSIELN